MKLYFEFFFFFPHAVSTVRAVEDRVIKTNQVSFVVLFDIMVGCFSMYNLCLRHCFCSVPG